MKDWLKKPASIKTNEEMKRVLRAVAGPMTDEVQVLIATPAIWPKEIDDARDDLASCRKCSRAVWISPSSRAPIANGVVVVCVSCIARQLRV